jgi:hypothetical protein
MLRQAEIKEKQVDIKEMEESAKRLEVQTREERGRADKASKEAGQLRSHPPRMGQHGVLLCPPLPALNRWTSWRRARPSSSARRR